MENILEVKEWNISAQAGIKVANKEFFSQIKNATVFHSDPKKGKEEQIMDGQVASRYWDVKFITQVGNHYYFEISPRRKQ